MVARNGTKMESYIEMEIKKQLFGQIEIKHGTNMESNNRLKIFEISNILKRGVKEDF
jgi:hypothetical protein